jgi:hypothetical protein
MSYANTASRFSTIASTTTASSSSSLKRRGSLEKKTSVVGLLFLRAKTNASASSSSSSSSVSSSSSSGKEEKDTLKKALFEEVFGMRGSSSSSTTAVNGNQRMAKSLDKARLQSIVASLEETMVGVNTIENTELLCGRWKLLCTYKEDVDKVEFFDLQSWQRYLFEKGPSPVQSLVLGNTSTVKNVYQMLEDPKTKGAKWQNIAKFTFEFNGERKDVELIIEAEIEGLRDEQSFYYRFSNGFFDVNGGEFKLPYPVPFDFIESVRPGQTKGWFQTTYLDEDLRVSVGQKGSKFILMREK